MNRRGLFVGLLLCMVVCGFNLEAKTTTTKVRLNEKWWGFYVNDSPSQPFSQPFNAVSNEYKSDGGFTKSVMFSSDGRYLWCDDKIDIRFTGDSIIVNSDKDVKLVKAGRNLREAFLVCCHKNFPPANRLPSSDLITSVVYETNAELGFELNQQNLLEYASKLLSEGYPAGVIVLGAGWRDISGGCDFDKRIFPDAKAMIDKLHEMGFQVMLTYTPLITPVGLDYMRLRDNNLLMKNKRGAVLIVRSQIGYQACVNIGVSEASSQLKEGVDFLKEQYNIDGFRYDASSVLPYLNDSGDKDAFMREWLSFGQKDVIKEYMPGAVQKFSAHMNCFNDDTPITWENLSVRVNNLISSGLCGYAYSHGLALKENLEAIYNDNKLMAYYLQLAAFMPVCSVDFAPWRIQDEKLRESVKQTLLLRNNMKDFLDKSLNDLAKTSEPIIRNMEYQFGKTGFSDCINQFMLVDKYLVVVPDKQSDKVVVRFPRGVWKTPKGELVKGPVVRSVNVEDGKIIYFELNN